MRMNGNYSYMIIAKRIWHGNQQCCFCHENETIQHLFFDCRFARLGWATAYAAWGLPRPHSVDDMFGNWLDGIQSNLKPLILLGASILCWPLWLCRNAFIFEKTHFFLQVIYLTTHWLRTWAVLQKSSSQEVVVAASRYLAQVAMEFFTRAYE